MWNVNFKETIGSFFTGKGNRLNMSSEVDLVDPYNIQFDLINMTGITCRTIFDIGAYHGHITRRYRALFPDAVVHSFEPFPDSFDVLRENTRDDLNVRHVMSAVAKKSGLCDFYTNYASATNSIYKRPKGGKKYYPDEGSLKEKITIKSISIDEYVEAESVANIDILKFDIQGGELQALQGARKLLCSNKVSLIYTEVMYIPHSDGGALMHEICSYLSEFDYSLFNTYNNSVATDGQLRQGDAIFLSPLLRDLLEKNKIDNGGI